MNISETIKSRNQQLYEMRLAIIGDIAAVMSKHKVTSVDITEADDPLDVCWWSHKGDLYEVRVNSVNIDENGIVSMTANWFEEDEDIELEPDDFAMQNPYWLNQAYEAVCQMLSEIEA